MIAVCDAYPYTEEMSTRYKGFKRNLLFIKLSLKSKRYKSFTANSYTMNNILYFRDAFRKFWLHVHLFIKNADEGMSVSSVLEKLLHMLENVVC